MPQLEISSKHRKRLRGLAHSLQPVVLIGQEGLTRGVIDAADEALLAHELIKVRMHQPIEKKIWAERIAAATKSALCGLVGHTIILYRPHPEKPKIKLDADAGPAAGDEEEEP